MTNINFKVDPENLVKNMSKDDLQRLISAAQNQLSSEEGFGLTDVEKSLIQYGEVIKAFRVLRSRVPMDIKRAINIVKQYRDGVIKEQG